MNSEERETNLKEVNAIGKRLFLCLDVYIHMYAYKS